MVRNRLNCVPFLEWPAELNNRDRGIMRRILSIDGGGIRGVFPAAFLASFEDELVEPIGSYFDLICGTSTGGIIAICLALGLPARDILALYETRGPEIFGQDHTGIGGMLRRIGRTVRGGVLAPKYRPETLREALTETLGERRLGDARTRLMIPAWHPPTRKVYIYKTAHHPRYAADYKIPAIDAALATAAAPTFFPQHVGRDGIGLVDGGIWANNPVGYAVAEAIGALGWERTELKVLSLSCLEDIFATRDQYSKAGIAFDAVSFFMAGQSHASLGMARILTGDPHERTSIYRICQGVPDRFFSLDGTARISALKDRALVEAREQNPILAPVFFNQPAEPFSPHHILKG